jgi:hypothetical protein
MKVGNLVRWKNSNDMGIVVECHVTCLFWFAGLNALLVAIRSNHPCIEVISESR